MSTRTSSPPRRLVDDELWALLAPLIPARRPGRGPGGRPPVDDRQAVEGIIFVLTTGISGTQLPTALVGCFGVTCGRRLLDCTEAGVWPALHQLLLA